VTTVYTTPASSNYHLDATCQALDSARLYQGGEVHQRPADKVTDRRPCLVCAGEPGRSEWVLTPDNLDELWELIDASKAHYGIDPVSGRNAVDGLTIWPHADRPRTWARFGDTIRHHDGRYTVTSPNGDPR
jgi:hypothetical protein